MIANDDELRGPQARIAYFEDLLAQMRVAAPAEMVTVHSPLSPKGRGEKCSERLPEMFPTMASGYRAEIEKMQREVLEYLTITSVSFHLPKSHDEGKNDEAIPPT